MSEYVKKYNPTRSAEWNYGGAKWRLSRSKIDLFLECPRCFYIDNKLGTKRPSIPSFNLNIVVDTLFKKEFDLHRIAKTRHRIMEEHGLNVIPFAHTELDSWRDPFQGISCTHEKTGLVVSGAVDDIWQQDDDSLIIVDYKATSKADRIVSLSDSPWESQYRRQIGVYQWLFAQNGFKVAPVGYILYANALTSSEKFDAILSFDVTLIPCEGDASWIPTTLETIHTCLNSDEIPPVGQSCEFCPYREACGKKLQAIHLAESSKRGVKKHATKAIKK